MKVSHALRAALFGTALIGSAMVASAEDAAPAATDGSAVPAAATDAAGAATDAAGAAAGAATDAAGAAAAPVEQTVKKVKKKANAAAAAATGTTTDAGAAAPADGTTPPAKKTATKKKAAKAAAAPNEVWVGKANQVGDSKGYTVQVGLTAKAATITYPELSCSGTLTKVGTKGDSSFFTETITQGAASAANPHGCLAGTVTLIRSSDATIFGWLGAYQGKPIVAYATLARAAVPAAQ